MTRLLLPRFGASRRPNSAISISLHDLSEPIIMSSFHATQDVVNTQNVSSHRGHVGLIPIAPSQDTPGLTKVISLAGYFFRLRDRLVAMQKDW
jgi:hypothetical protein